MSHLRSLPNVLIKTDLYASFLAALIAPIASILCKVAFDPIPFFMIFFSALVVYALNRQGDREIDSVNVPERTSFVGQYGWIVLSCAMAGFFSLLTYAYLSSNASWPILVALFVGGIAYSFPVLSPLRSLLGFSRFKEAFILKNASASLMYGMFALIPLAYCNLSFDINSIGIALFVFLRFFVISTLFDTRDIEGDSKGNIRTIPVKLGKEKTIFLLHTLNALTVLLACLWVVVFEMPFLFVLMAVSSVIFSEWYIKKSQEPGCDMRFLCGVVIEADYLPPAIIGFMGALLLH